MKQETKIINDDICLKKTFKDSDCMDLKTFADDLFKVIEVENIITQNSVVISLNAKFGMGKSYFLEMFKNYLIDEKNSKTLLINSWKNDFCNDPLVAICCELISYFELQKDEKTLPIREQLKCVVSIFADLSNQFIKSKLGVDFQKTIDQNKSIFYGNKIYEIFKHKNEIFQKLYQLLTDYAEEQKIIILIDELDRTRPDYAINFLETLKHFFDVKGLTFILAVNKEQLKQSVECIYGKINFDEYYRKFAQLDIALPYSLQGIKKFIIKTVDEYFLKMENAGKKIGIEAIHKKQNVSKGWKIKGYMLEFFTKFNLSLRQINQFFRIFLMLSIDNNSKINFASQIASIIIIAIHLHDSEVTEKILNNEFKFEDILQYLDQQKINLNNELRIGVNLLFLTDQTSEELNKNRDILDKKFNIKITNEVFESKNSLFYDNPGCSHNDELDLIKDIANRVLHSKNFFQKLT